MTSPGVDDPWNHAHFSRFRPPIEMAGAVEPAAPLEICFLVGSLDISGGTYVILQHAVEAHRRGERVTVVPLFEPTERTTDWHPALAELTISTLDDLTGHRFDVVVATWWRTVYELHRVRARRYVYFVQSVESRFYAHDQPHVAALAERTYGLPLGFITISPWIQAWLGLERGRVSFLAPNGVDKRRFSPIGATFAPRTDQALRVLVEGPIDVPMKQVPETIEVVRESKADEIWLLTSSTIEDYPGVDRVFSRVPIDVTPGVYRSCDVLVKLSRVEGMFGPPLEMLHCGGTAVVWDVTGHEDYIVHEENALVVPTGDFDGVTAALDQLATDPELTAGLRRGGLETASAWPDWTASSAGFLRWLRVLALHEQPQSEIDEVIEASERGVKELR